MAIRCPGCDQAISEEELPRLAESARVLCPQCEEPLTLPEMTLPIGLDAMDLPRADEGMDPAKKYALLVLKGAESGKVFEISKRVVTIGRSDCDLLLDDPEISRRHAKVEIEGDRATVEDLGSTNGIYLGDDRVERATLENRSKFRVGNHELAFVVTDR